jgi:hypothetical protein
MKEHIYSNGIKADRITEGNLAAVKNSSDFGGPNMWDLYVKDKHGYWTNIQWMDVSRIQQFFKTKLPVYKEQTKQTKYELV